MSLFNDIKYANMLAPYLELFSKKNDNIWNFRCPVCGDSKKNPTKKRGFIYRPPKKNYLAVKCHNCPYTAMLGQFIERINPEMYKDYLLEAFKEREQVKKEPETLPEIFQEMELSDSILDPLQRLDKLPETHPAVLYIKKRMIPLESYKLFYFTKKFKQYVNNIIPNKFSSTLDDHPRLVIPYFNKHGKCFAFQGRAFGKEDPKYFTIKIDERAERIYGLDRLNYNKQIYVVEGPIDSIFLPNAIAVSGSSYDCDTLRLIKTNCVIVPDNEPRNKDICKVIEKSIDLNYKVCLWPDTFIYKDINDAILGGLTKSDILSIINSNIYQGVSAKLRFTRWRKR